jgi:hypothetical protein
MRAGRTSAPLFWILLRLGGMIFTTAGVGGNFAAPRWAKNEPISVRSDYNCLTMLVKLIGFNVNLSNFEKIEIF